MTPAEAPKAEYLEDADILYVAVRDAPIARSGEAGSVWINVDYAADGSVVAVEFVNAATIGVDLTHVPERETVERLIREAGISLPLKSPA
ncbi:MAG: DUF2283 domain-containing protein [Dehalococcoidia bacterium]